MQRRRVCFVTGTRAEFGLMRSTLQCIRSHAKLSPQLIVTGMHLDRSRGHSIDLIRREGWRIDAVIPWRRGNGSETDNAVATGTCIAALTRQFQKLKTDMVLVVGDRVEAFAAASAAHISGLVVAHVHGGDRALGLIDDSLRHAITKLSHIHFPATISSARRISQLGEDSWRIFPVGSPGLDDLKKTAVSRSELIRAIPGIIPGKFALLVLHPQTSDPNQEKKTAEVVLRAIRSTGFAQTVIVYPNNDPGSNGIATYWDTISPSAACILRRDLPRNLYLALLREAAVAIGNSSSGIIEAASFGTPVLDLGTRQAGRERGQNVVHAPMQYRNILQELRKIWNAGAPIRFPCLNIYGNGGAGQRIASKLAGASIAKFRSKLIAY